MDDEYGGGRNHGGEFAPSSNAAASPSKRVVQPSSTSKPVSYSDRFIPSRAGTSRLDCTVLERETVASHVPVKGQDKDQDSASVYGMVIRSELLGCSSTGGGASLPSSPEKNPQGGSGGSTGEASVPHFGLLESPMGRMSNGRAGGVAGPSSQGTPGTGRKTLFRYVTDSSDAYGNVCKSPFQQRGLLDGSDIFGSNESTFTSPGRLPRRINRSPFKVLDAPQLADDFYLNLVDWSATNTLAVGLGSAVYLWSACTSKVTRLVDLGRDTSVCSVAWSQRGHYLSVGVDNGDVQLWDAVKCRRLRLMAGHRQRVGCMNWSHHVLATGSRDRSILLRDVRAPEHSYAKLSAHRSEVCGLKWSPDDREIASGGNDNHLMIWQPGHSSSSDPVQKFSLHTAAVKAIAWSPHQHGLIASGGGTADRCIKFWNTSTGAALNSVDTGSQVCNLAWSKNVNEIVSTHGYSQNQIIVWRYQGMQKLATLTGHTLRVLYLACSPDGQTIVTGAGDETLRFWNVFPGPKAQAGGAAGVGSMMRTVIR
ncbi:hypothetical protein M9434_005736 [Picochlorum sp. BPE23]|nr:hypothetical protein M9434_005736 [Picochlorum sp. BPE23]